MTSKISWISIFILTLHSPRCLHARSPPSAQAQLIHEFARSFKHIHRVSLLSCHNLPVNCDFYRTPNQTTSPTSTTTNAIINSLTFVESLFKAEGILIKVLAIDTLSASWSTTSSRMELWKSFLQSEDHRQVVVLNLSCGNNSLEILELASYEGFFNSSYHWLLIDEDGGEREFRAGAEADCKDYSVNRSRKVDDSQPVDEFEYKRSTERLQYIEFLSKLNISMNTELLFAKRNDRDGTYVLYDIWSPGRQYGGELNVTEVGRFSQHDDLQMYNWFKETTSIVRRMDTKNALIRCMIVITSHMTENFEDYLNHQHNPHLDSMHRFNFNLLSHVRDMFNFRFHLFRTNSWGYLKNGTFDGMIGALVRREVDIGGSPVFFHEERAAVIDYTTRTWIARPCFIFRHPNSTRYMRNIFLQPFSNQVWICIGICGLVSVVILWHLRHTEENLLDETDTTDTLTNRGKRIHGRNCNLRDFLASILNCRHKSQLAIVLRRFFGKFFYTRKAPHPIATPANATTCFQTKTDYRNFPNNSNNHRKDFRLSRPFCSCKLNDATEGLEDTPRAKDDCSRTSNANEANICAMSNGGKYSKRTTMPATYLQQNRRKDRLSWLNLNGSSNEIAPWGTSRSFQCCILFFIAAICQQGPHYSCHLVSGRVVILSTLLFAFCISQFYSGTIVGTRLMEKPKTMKNIRDLIDSSLEVAIEDILYTHDYFRRTTDPDAIELYRRKISQPVDVERKSDTGWNGRHSINNNKGAASNESQVFTIPPGGRQGGRKIFRGEAVKGVAGVKQRWLSPEKGLELMKAGGYAFHVDVATAYKIIRETFTEQEICELTEIQLFPPQKMVGIVQKGSPLRKMITYGLRRTAETGLMDRQRKLWHSPKPPCVRQIQPINLRVEMETVASALFVLIFGLAASGMILALEVSYDLWQRRSTATKSPDIGQEWRRTAEEQHKQRCNHPAASPKDNVGEKDFEFVN